jgi:hypothetical protein
VQLYLSDRQGAFGYVASIWKQIQKNSKFEKVVMADETLSKLAQKVRREFVTQMSKYEKLRANIANQIHQEYDLRVDQEQAFLEKIDTIPSHKLETYLLPVRRNQLL